MDKECPEMLCDVPGQMYHLEKAACATTLRLIRCYLSHTLILYTGCYMLTPHNVTASVVLMGPGIHSTAPVSY
jgi:hypothetical protein